MNSTENMPVTAASPEELAFRLARGGIRGTAGTENDHLQKVQKLLDAAWKQLELLREQTKGIYSPEGNADLQAVLSDPLKDAIPYSCSAIETWLTCPFKYFLMKKLKLEQPQQPGTGTDAAQVGSMNHKVMELTFAPGTIYDSKEEALSKAEKNIEKVFKDAPREFGFRESELWEFEKDKLKQKLLETIDRMFTAARSKMPVNDSWMSVGTEMKFGYPKEEAEGTKPLMGFAAQMSRFLKTGERMSDSITEKTFCLTRPTGPYRNFLAPWAVFLKPLCTMRNFPEGSITQIMNP